LVYFARQDSTALATTAKKNTLCLVQYLSNESYCFALIKQKQTFFRLIKL